MARIGSAFVLELVVAFPFAAALHLDKADAEAKAVQFPGLPPLPLPVQIPGQAPLPPVQIPGVNVPLAGAGSPTDKYFASLLKPITDGVNASFDDLHSQMKHILPSVSQGRVELINGATEGWPNFTTKLTKMISNTAKSWKKVPFKQVQPKLDSAGVGNLVPKPLNASLHELNNVSSILDYFLQVIGPMLQNSTPADAHNLTNNQIMPFLTQLEGILPQVQSSKKKMKSGYKHLEKNILEHLEALPTSVLVPKSVWDTLDVELDQIGGKVNKVADTSYQAIEKIALSIPEAVNIVLTAPGNGDGLGGMQSDAPKRAVRLGGLLTTAALVLAFKGLP